jgi:large subunit ribosomal protein L10
MMTRAQKAQEIANISERFSKSKAAFLVDFKGMNVEEVTEFRKKLAPLESEMKVVRNTLAKLALKENPDMDPSLSESFVGTNALVFAYEDPSASAKAIIEYGKDVEELVVKAGVMDGKTLTEDSIKYLATLPGKDELRAKLLGTLSAPMGQLVRTLNEVPSSFVRVLAAKKDEASA